MSDKTVSAVFGFRNRQAAAVFGGDVSELDSIQPYLNNTGSDWIVPDKIALIEAGDSGGAAGLTFSGDKESIEAVFSVVEKYGGWLKGGFEADPSVASHAIELALLRGWVPGKDEENRPGGLGYAPVILDHGQQGDSEHDRKEAAIGVGTLAEDEADGIDDFYGADEDDEYWVDENEPEGSGKRKWFIAGGVLVLVMVIAVVATFALNREEPLADELAKSDEARILESASPPEVVSDSDRKNAKGTKAELNAGDSIGEEDSEPSPESSAMAPRVPVTEEQLQQIVAATDLMIDAAKLLRGEAEEISAIRNSADLLAILDGAKTSAWNPKAFCLIPESSLWVDDPWYQKYEVRVDSVNDKSVLRIWSRGPDMVDEDGEGDDVPAPPAALDLAVGLATEMVEDGAPVDESTTNLLASLKKREDLSSGWSWEGDSLVSPSNGDFTQVGFVSDVPESFTAKLIVERRSGKNGLAFGFSARNRRTNARFDGTGRSKNVGPIRLSGMARRAMIVRGETLLLPVRERKELIVRVSPEKIETEIVGGPTYRWRGESDDLSVFPTAYARADDRWGFWLGTKESSFAIHSVEVNPEGEGAERMPVDNEEEDEKENEVEVKGIEPPFSPPVDLPSLSVIPRTGILPLGWKLLGLSKSKSIGTIPPEWKEEENVRKVAVFLELDGSEFDSEGIDPSAIKMPKEKPTPSLEHIETIRPGEFEIRCGGVVREAAGLAYSASNEDDLLDIETVSGTKNLFIEIRDGEVFRNSFESDQFHIVHKTPVKAEGRKGIALWVYFQDKGGSSPLFVRKKGGTWKRVPDRETELPAAPIPPIEIPSFSMPPINIPDINIPDINIPQLPPGLVRGKGVSAKTKAPTAGGGNEMRDWTNVDGKKITAKLVGTSEKTAGLQMANGKIYNYPLSQLSSEDREYIKKKYPNSK